MTRPDIDDESERLFWEFASMMDPTQTQTPLSQRDAFKRIVRPLLLAATYEINKGLRAERDTLRDIVRAADAMRAREHAHDGKTRGCVACSVIAAYDERRAKWKDNT